MPSWAWRAPPGSSRRRRRQRKWRGALAPPATPLTGVGSGPSGRAPCVRVIWMSEPERIDRIGEDLKRLGCALITAPWETKPAGHNQFQIGRHRTVRLRATRNSRAPSSECATKRQVDEARTVHSPPSATAVQRPPTHDNTERDSVRHEWIGYQRMPDEDCPGDPCPADQQLMRHLFTFHASGLLNRVCCRLRRSCTPASLPTRGSRNR